MTHPQLEVLGALARGELPRAEVFAVRAHVISCEECTRALEAIEVAPISAPHLGRYLLLDELGRGGMGRVFRAFDPQLERFVAVKKLLDSGQSDESRQRLLREAQAMAKLVHPHLVSVFDAGLSDDDVFLVMEYVKGTTLAHWLREKPRTWNAVLAVFLEAGRGLEAAHAAGLVHRDFKPSNVLVQGDHAKVTDFGLALLAGSAPEFAAGQTSSSSGAASRVTRAGATPGTPEFMAPEQFRGEFDARSDQFSFARSLENALAGRQAPGWLEAPLRRALSPSPGARFASMTELLAALSPEPRAQRRRIAIGTIAAVVMVGIAVGSLRARRVDCSAASAPLEAVWSPQARAALETRATALPAASAARVRSAFASWADDWSQRARTSCEASVAGKQSEKVELLRGLCLERRLAFFGTLTQNLTGDLDPEHLVSVADSLKPGECSDEALIADGSAEESPALREQLEPLRVQLQKVEALTLIGRRELALSEVSSCLKEAREVGFGPFIAQLAVVKGEFLTREEPAQARALFRESYILANVPQGSARTQLVAARAAIEYLDTFEAAPETLAALQAMTEAALARVGNTPSSQATYLTYLGKAALARGDAKAAVDALSRGLSLRQQLDGLDDAATIVLAQNLATAFSLSGDVDRAIALFEDVVARQEARFGADSLPYAHALAQLGSEEVVAVRYESARKHLQVASAVLSKNGVELGRESDLLDNLASMLEIEGDFVAARRVREKLLEFEKAPLTRAKYLGLMSRVLVEVGDVEGARRDAAEAIMTLEKVNPMHPDLQVPLTALGRVTAGPRGAALLDRALKLPRVVDHEYRGDVLRALAERESGAARRALLARARAEYTEAQVAFRVRELEPEGP